MQGSRVDSQFGDNFVFNLHQIWIAMPIHSEGYSIDRPPAGNDNPIYGAHKRNKQKVLLTTHHGKPRVD